MMIDRICRARASAIAFAIGLGALSLTPEPAEALNNNQQLLLGGGSTTENSTRYTSPGFGNQFTRDFPATNLGPRAAAARMLGGGVISRLLVKIYTTTVPSSGNFTVTVLVNNAPTALTCTLTGTGQCATSGAVTVNVPNNAMLAIEVANDFVASGNIAYSYSLLLD